MDLGYTGAPRSPTPSTAPRKPAASTMRLISPSGRRSAGTDIPPTTGFGGDPSRGLREAHDEWSANGSISKAALEASYERILALKAGF